MGVACRTEGRVGTDGMCGVVVKLETCPAHSMSGAGARGGDAGCCSELSGRG